jgi:hypothetical protein
VLLGAVVATALALRPPDDRMGPPKGFKLGKLMPPHVREGLDLTDDQETALAALETEVKGKLERLLTDEQRRAVERLGKRPPPGGEKGKKGGPPKEPQAAVKAEGGIAWFTSLDSGLKEAKRSGLPILLVSAAPHCAGVPGIW